MGNSDLTAKVKAEISAKYSALTDAVVAMLEDARDADNFAHFALDLREKEVAAIGLLRDRNITPLPGLYAVGKSEESPTSSLGDRLNSMHELAGRIANFPGASDKLRDMAWQELMHEALFPVIRFAATESATRIGISGRKLQYGNYDGHFPDEKSAQTAFAKMDPGFYLTYSPPLDNTVAPCLGFMIKPGYSSRTVQRFYDTDVHSAHSILEKILEEAAKFTLISDDPEGETHRRIIKEVSFAGRGDNIVWEGDFIKVVAQLVDNPKGSGRYFRNDERRNDIFEGQKQR